MIVDAAVRNHIYIDVQKQGTIFKRNSYGIKNSDKNKKPRQSDYEGFLSKIKGLIGTTIEKGTYNSSLGSLNTDIEKFCKKNYKNNGEILPDWLLVYYNTTITLYPGVSKM